MRRGERSVQGSDRSQSIEPPQHYSRESFGSRQHLYRDFLERGQRPERTGHQLAEIVARDGFDDFPACLENSTPPADTAKPEEMIACGACLDTTRPRKIAD